jgi:hypothetical protein
MRMRSSATVVPIIFLAATTDDASCGGRHEEARHESRLCREDEMRVKLDSAPAPVQKALARLFHRLGVHDVVVVPVRAERDSEFDECFAAVEEKIARDGGEPVYGWAIHADPILVEAECHAVWQGPTGELVDATPKRDDSRATSFITDPRISDDGRQRNNVRLPVYEKDAIVTRFIRVCDEIFEVMNRGERAEQLGTIMIPAAEIVPLIQKRELLATRMSERPFGPDEPCVCGRSRKLKKCCGI